VRAQRLSKQQHGVCGGHSNNTMARARSCCSIRMGTAGRAPLGYTATRGSKVLTVEPVGAAADSRLYRRWSYLAYHVT